MVDTHLINMFLVGFGIAAGVAVLLTIAIIGFAASRRNGGRIGTRSLTAARAWTPLADARTPEAKAALASFSEPAVRESAVREPVLR